MTRMIRRFCAGAVILGVATGCASVGATPASRVSSAPCPPTLEPYLRTSLYMDRSNRNDPSGRLTDDEWQGFVDEILLRHFPAGGTIFLNSGWWRRPDGSTGGGPGRTLVVLSPVSEAESHRSAVGAVIAEVKARYGHRSVLWEEGRVCVTF